MPKYFSENPSQWSRSVQIWQILISKAHNHQILNYNELGKLVDYWGNRVGNLALILDIINRYCIKNDLPLLPCLVLSKKTGQPSKNVNWTVAKLNTERAEVFKRNWFEIYPPSEDDFMKLYD